MLFAALLACVGVMKAGVTDLPEKSTEGNIKWYTIKNTRSGRYANYVGDAANMSQVSTPSLSSLFYFTASDAETVEGFTPVMIHNIVTTNKLADFTSWTEAGNAWFLSTDAQNNPAAGLHITKTAAVGVWNGPEGWNALNDKGSSSITNYCAIDGGSVFVIEAVEATKISELVAAYKTNAINALKTLGTAIDVAAVENAINAVAVEGGNYGKFMADVNAVVDAATQYVAFRNGDADEGSVRYNNYLGVDMVNSKGNGTGTFNHLSAVWSLKYTGNGSFYIYNVNNKVYLGNPDSRGNLTVAPNAEYTFELIEGNKVEFKSGNQTLHMNNHNGSETVSSGNALTNYDSDDSASRWYVETAFATHVEAYKASALSTLESWEALSVVFDAELIKNAKTAINDIATTDYATFVAIDAELTKVTDIVAAKMFAFQTKATDGNRDGVWVAANANTMKAFGAAKDAQDYNAVWSLQHAGGSSFYLYNELNKVYLGAPVDNQNAVVLTDTPAAAYTFEMITDKGDNVVEMHSNGGTLHASNHSDKKLISYDGDEDASRWMVNVTDITKDIKELLATIKEGDYAEKPELGQYSKAGYEALVAASTTAKTVEEVAEAIAAFKAAKNLPVFTIGNGGVKDYAAGKSIYDNNSDKLYFKSTNVFDKTMWWALDQVETTVSVTGDNYVGIYNVGTGNGFWGASSIKVAETSDATGEDDGLFLFYTTGNNIPVHFQKQDSEIVRWGSTEATSGSAAKFTYIGNTYDLNQLTNEHLTAANELAAVTVPDFTFKAGVNNYSPTTKSALDAAVDNRTKVLNSITSTADAIVAAKTQLETAIADVSINQPEAGKFYRVRCAGTGMKYLQSTLDNTDENNVRLQVLSDAKAADAIFCYIDGALVSYTTGLYINAYRFNEVGTKSDVVFSKASNGKVGAYNITVGGRYIFGAQDNNKIDSGSNPDARDGYNWWLEEVTTLPVTITSAGYATFFAPVAVTLPEGVTAHTVTVNGNYAVLSEAIDVVPANNGVILKGEGTYDLTITNTDAADLENALEGVVAKTLVEKTQDDAYYVLAKKGEVVGLYNPVNGEDENTFFCSGFKAYWLIAATQQGAGYRIGDKNTTAIDQLLNENGEVVIYDITGRRVEKMEKGIYIVNGKKVVIK